MMFNILKDYHVMIGVDFHKAVFPPPVPPNPWMPHFCIAPLCIPPWGGLTGKPNGSVFSSGLGRTLSQGTDIGSLIPHVPIPPSPNLLLPIIILTSGSKSEFGAHAQVASEGPVAFAVAKVVNFNLNCAGPACPPLPTGVVITFNTNTTGVTIGDIVAGLLRMVVDAAVQYALNRIFASNTVSNFLERITSAIAAPIFARIAPWAVNAFTGDAIQVALGSSVAARMLGEAADSLLGAIAADLIGSPLGYSPGWSPVGGFMGNLEDKGQSTVQQAVDNYFNNPAIDQHPSQPPAQSQPSAQPQPSAPPPTATSPDAGTPPSVPSSSAPDATTSTSTSPPPGSSSPSSSPTTPPSGGVCDPSDPDSL